MHNVRGDITLWRFFFVCSALEPDSSLLLLTTQLPALCGATAPLMAGGGIACSAFRTILLSLILLFFSRGVIISTSAPEHEAGELRASPNAFSQAFYDRSAQETRRSHTVV